MSSSHLINSDYLPPPFLFPVFPFSGNLHSESMWQLNLRHFQWDTALSMKGIQGIDDEVGNEIFEILDEHVRCLTWHPLFFAHRFFSHRFCCCFCLSLKKVMLNMAWATVVFHGSMCWVSFLFGGLRPSLFAVSCEITPTSYQPCCEHLLGSLGKLVIHCSFAHQ